MQRSFIRMSGSKMGNRKNRIVYMIALSLAGILAASLIWSVMILRPSDSRVVEVVQDGRTLYIFDLDGAEDGEFTVYYEGRGNTILVKDGEICVSAAECPDQICVNMGKLYSDAPIVCLPHHLIIRFAD